MNSFAASDLKDCLDLLGKEKLVEVFTQLFGGKTLVIIGNDSAVTKIVNLLKRYSLFDKANFELNPYKNKAEYLKLNNPNYVLP